MSINTYYYVPGDEGQISASYHVDDATCAALIGAGLDLREGKADMDLHYLVDGVLTARPEVECTMEGGRITGLVPPCIISIDGTDYACGESVAEIEFPTPGRYTVRIIPPWPYLIKEFAVDEN